MSGKKVSSLTAITSAQSADEIYVINGGNSRKITTGNFADTMPVTVSAGATQPLSTYLATIPDTKITATGSTTARTLAAHLSDVVSVQGFASLNAAITQIGATEKTLRIDTTLTVSSDVTVPANVAMVFTGDGQINPSSGITVTLNCPIEAGRWQIFGGAGTIAGVPKTHVFYPEWWGAVADDTTDSHTGFNSAVTMAQNVSGGIVDFAGLYKLGQTLVIPDAADGLTLRGDGENSSKLNFAGGSAGNGIEIRGTSFVTLEGFRIIDGQGHNIAVLGSSSAFSNPNWLTVKNVKSLSAVNSGFYLEDLYLSTFENVWSDSNTNHGFELAGYHTSLAFISCQGRLNTLDGWKIDDVSYSRWLACASDQNTRYGYNVANVTGVEFGNCGSESNTDSGWFVAANSTLASGRTLPNVHDLVLAGCFATGNDSGGSGANLIEVAGHTGTGNPLRVHLERCRDTSPGGANSLLVSGFCKVTEKDNDLAGTASYSTFAHRVPDHGPLYDASGKSVTGASTPIVSLTNLFGSTTEYSCVILIEARSKKWGDATANTASYLLMVTKASAGTTGAQTIQQNGMLAGSGATWPSFTWSLDTTNNHLEASPVSSTTGTFYFNIRVLAGDAIAALV